MGCSASCPANFIAQQQNPTSNTSSSSPHSYSQSPLYSLSEPSSTPASKRTLSLPTPLVHHPPLRKGDSNHYVSLISTTYGSLVLVDHNPNPNSSGRETVRLETEVNDAKDFGEKEEPLSPHSVINTWELMEGLDDEAFQFHVVESPKKRDDDGNKSEVDGSEIPKFFEIVEQPSSKPLWQHLSEESLLAKLDHNVASTYRKALLSRTKGCKTPENALISRKLESLESPHVDSSTSYYQQSNGVMKSKNVEPFEPSDVKSSVAETKEEESCYLKGAEDRIVLYHTSLRSIRKTYEDCCAVRVIFRGFRVRVDERDISMDRSFKTELQDALEGKTANLPQVFIRGKHIGGAEEIKLLNEEGELTKLVEGFPIMDLGFVCENCGDARFLLCTNCSGSRKVYEDEGGTLKRCPHCNENGLVRCSACCCS